jgi:signal transduction histidine kinase
MIRNAILAAPEEGFVELSLKQDPDSRNKAVILSVFNSGKGIKEIDITRLFTTIVPETDIKINGLGIDMKEFSILKMLVEEMDDTLNIVSDPVEGTSFVLKIPLR